MVTKRIRSEYMKRFKDPKWETYTKCYEEMLKYRLTRRLLEHTHNPWFWSGSDTDSDSGGRSPPAPSKNQVRAEAGRDRAETGRDRAQTGRDRAETGRDRADTGRDRAEAGRDRAEAELEECEGARVDRRAGPVPGLPLQEKKEEEEEEESVSAPQPAAHGSHEGTRETRVPEEESEEQAARSRGSRQLAVPPREQDRERDTGAPQRSKPSKSRQTWRSQRVRPAPTQQPGEGSKESRHPFALYGSGEKDADIAGRKTHNVGPAASTNEIHESALRAKTRREVERQIQTQRTERRRAKSADQDKARKLVQPEFNPWLTEYMRCFSARSR